MTTTAPEIVDLGQYIEIRDGRAHIRGRRVQVLFIASAARARNRSIRELADDYGLSETQVAAALFYYQLHREELDAQDAADAEEAEKIRAQHRTGLPSQDR